MVDFVHKRQDSYQWFTVLEERKQKEIEWNKVYDTPSFRHGTDGHNLRIIVSELAKKLNEYEDQIDDLQHYQSEIESLEEEVDELRDENNALKNDLSSSSDCEDCDDIISNEINELEQSNAHLISELEDSNERIKELERAIEQLEKLKDKEDA